jgi:four helix bundle protein
MHRYDLEKRTEEMAVHIISFCRSMKQDAVVRPLISQLTRSATSVGANYREANGAGSLNDFAHKIHLCKKEAKETYYWLGVIRKSIPEYSEKAKLLQGEIYQFILIFGKIAGSIKRKNGARPSP